MRATIAIGAYTGVREADVLKFTWGMRSSDYIRQNKADEELSIPEHSKLAKVLGATSTTAMVVVMNTRSNPYTETGFRTLFHNYQSAAAVWENWLRSDLPWTTSYGRGQTGRRRGRRQN